MSQNIKNASIINLLDHMELPNVGRETFVEMRAEAQRAERLLTRVAEFSAAIKFLCGLGRAQKHQPEPVRNMRAA